MNIERRQEPSSGYEGPERRREYLVSPTADRLALPPEEVNPSKHLFVTKDGDVKEILNIAIHGDYETTVFLEGSVTETFGKDKLIPVIEKRK